MADAGTGPAAGRAAGKAAGQAVGSVRRSFAPWTDPAAIPLIRYEGVSRRFGDVTAVNGVDLAIFEREFFCLLGPSGCGKTTLMRMLAGFETPTSGRILLGGVDLAGLPPYRRPVNMMFQSYALFPHMTVERNIAFGLKQDGVARSEIADRVADALKMVQLEGYGQRRPDQLSGGQKQRVALARALVKRPKVLLLDEPLGALDKKLREETQFELMDLQVELGMTFLVVTHDQDEAMTMADRIAMMDRGRIAQVGTPAEIYETPATRGVAAFVGDVTMFEGTVEGHAGGLVAVAGAGAAPSVVVDAASTGQPLPPVGAAVAVAVRPEKIVIAQDPPPPGTPNVIEGEVWDIGYLGDWTTYRIRIGDGTIVRVSRANASRFVERPVTWEDRVWIHFAPGAGVLLAG
ncbi:ABC transporter ATP-binding protein [Alsobacter sp. R-9]